MKRLLLIASLVAALVPVCAVAQTSTPPGKATKVSFSGRIREDGCAILVEGRAWVVSNVEKLREHTGETVSVKGLLDPVTNEIHILSMKTRPPVNTARLGDSAFRR